MKKEYLDVPFEIKKDDIEPNGVFRGYGSTFGGKPDSYGDVIAAGAFNDSLIKGGRNGFGIAMLYQHMPDKPIGVWTTLAENKKGLFVEGQLAMKTQLGSETYELMRMGALRGLSIGYNIESEDDIDFDEDKKIRTLKKINLWEISPVTFPANTRAQITTVKMIEEAKNERELESALREAGLSRQAAKYMVKLSKHSLMREAGKESVVDPYLNDVLLAAKQINNDLYFEKIKQELKEQHF